MRREVSGLSTIICIPSPCGGGLGWGTPYSSRARREGEGQARSGGVFLGAFRRAERRGASRIIGGDPVNRRPGDRFRHGWRTPVFRAVQDSEAKKAKLGSKRRGRGEADQDEGPVDLRPAERARHGRRAPGLQARARTAKRSKARVQARHRECALPGPPETTRRAGQPAGFCGRWRRRRWLWELWPKPKFLVCRDETRLI